MKYKITITKIETKTVTKRGDYTIIDKRPWTDKELSEALSSHYGDKKDFLAKNPLKEVRDYAPSWQGVENEEIEVLKQTVETLDLAAVIKAVNGL
jgi:hypothetical protein